MGTLELSTHGAREPSIYSLISISRWLGAVPRVCIIILQHLDGSIKRKLKEQVLLGLHYCLFVFSNSFSPFGWL